ncbi:hypothetical protein [Rheinheimera fenheensis]|uniref:hypothetical protein n=1 Tax=Rheinheimera fenheensis TaxID=3152295 RepID=UPI003261A85F
MSAQQLSFMPKFGDVTDENYDMYSQGFAAWQQHVSQFASLLRYSAEQKVISQSWEQNAALFEAVSDDEQYRALLKIDLVTASLNMSFRNMVSGIRMTVEAERYAAKYSKCANKQSDEAPEKESDQAAKIELLELRESLLALEKEYTSEEAARRSVYWQRSSQFNDITPVLTPQKVWHGRDENSADAAVHDSRERRYIAATGAWQVGSWVTSYVLTFCEKVGAAA